MSSNMVGRRKKDYHLPPRMYLKSGSYYFVSAANKWLNLGKDLATAKRKWAELDGTGAATGGMAALMDRYMAEVAPLKAPRTYADNQVEMDNLRKVFGAMEPADVRPVHVAKYLDLRGQAAPTRANREKALLSHLFTMAMRWGVVDSNACKGVHRNTEIKRDRYITDEEFELVLVQANPTIQCLMQLGYMTAQRIGDLITLKRSQITDTGIAFTQGKTGKKLVVQMTDDLRELLDRIGRIHPRIKSLQVFSTRMGSPYSYDGVSSMFKRAVRQAGIEDFHFHDIRAKAITDAKRAGLDAQSLAGHSNETMTAHYVKRREIDSVAPLKTFLRRSA